jgi:hypothetical protein
VEIKRAADLHAHITFRAFDLCIHFWVLPFDSWQESMHRASIRGIVADY